MIVATDEINLKYLTLARNYRWHKSLLRLDFLLNVHVNSSLLCLISWEAGGDCPADMTSQNPFC